MYKLKLALTLVVVCLLAMLNMREYKHQQYCPGGR